MSVLIAVLVAAALIALAVYTKKKPGKAADCINLAVFLCGLLLLVGVGIHTRFYMGNSVADAELRGWASDMLGVWATYAGIAAAVLFALILLSLLLSCLSPDRPAAHKANYAAGLRGWLTVLASVLLLLAAALYTPMAAHDGLPTGAYVMLSGIGLAFLFRVFAPLERLLRRNGRK